MLLSAFLAATSQMMLKKSATTLYPKPYQIYLNPLVASAYAILFIATLLNMLSYLWISFKLGAVLSAASYVFVLFYSRLLFQEKLTRYKFWGMCLIFTGILIFLSGS